MKIRRDIFSFLNHEKIIIKRKSLSIISLLYTNNMAKHQN